MHASHFYPCRVTLMAGEPIDTTGMTPRQTDQLTERLRSAIVHMLESAPTTCASPI
jgi:1-acyl-sn-glycerol-3-phosphate acyltransferase